MSTNRLEKINSLLRDEVSKIILRDFEFSLPVGRQVQDILVTLTRVDTSANLIEAKVYISVFPDEEADKIVRILNKGIYDVQYKINRALRQRPIPKLRFVKDKEISKAGRVEEILAQVKDQIKD